jgi:DNA adenine methylase
MPQPILSPLRGHRAEVSLLAAIAKQAPLHKIRIEPMFHTGSFLFSINKPPAAEIINDCGGLVGDFWSTMRSETDFQRFAKLCHATPFCESAFREAHKLIHDEDPVLRAYAFFTINRLGLLRNPKQFAYISKTRTRHAMTEQASSFLSVVNKLPEFHERLRRVTYLSGRNPADVIREFDSQETLIVLTPQVKQAGYANLAELFGKKSEYDYSIEWELLSQLRGSAMLLLEAGQEVESELHDLGWSVVDFETRTWQSWLRQPPQPVRLWTSFRFRVGGGGWESEVGEE